MNFSCTKIGTIISKHGFDGSLILKVSSQYSNNLSKVDFLFIQINKKHIPFKLDSIKTFKNKSYKIKFNEVNDDAYANQLISKSVFIKSNDYPDLKKETNIYSAIIKRNFMGIFNKPIINCYMILFYHHMMAFGQNTQNFLIKLY